MSLITETQGLPEVRQLETRSAKKGCGMKKIIHVNRQHIAMNAKDDGNRPIYTIKQGGKTIYARAVTWDSPSRLVPQGQQLSCGARAWIETEADLTLTDPMTFAEARVAQ
jgi:hypothetical protein